MPGGDGQGPPGGQGRGMGPGGGRRDGSGRGKGAFRRNRMRRRFGMRNAPRDRGNGNCNTPISRIVG